MTERFRFIVQAGCREAAKALSDGRLYYYRPPVATPLSRYFAVPELATLLRVGALAIPAAGISEVQRAVFLIGNLIGKKGPGLLSIARGKLISLPIQIIAISDGWPHTTASVQLFGNRFIRPPGRAHV